MTNSSLGAELRQLSFLLEALIIKEPDLAKKQLLREQLAKVFDSLQSLVDANIDAATKEFKEGHERRGAGQWQGYRRAQGSWTGGGNHTDCRQGGGYSGKVGSGDRGLTDR